MPRRGRWPAPLYCFVSSISVYADFSVPVDESSPVASLGDLPRDEVTNESYGPLKALCEEVVVESFEGRALVVRPGLIVGPHDPTGRFTYWPHRFVRGGEVLAPAPPERPTQFVDVRDLGAWMVELCEREVGGTFNATNEGVPWGELLEACRATAGVDVRVIWVPDEFLLAHEVGSGWSCRSGSPTLRSPLRIASTSPVASTPASASGRWQTPCVGPSRRPRRPQPPGSRPSARQRCSPRGMAGKDYSGTLEEARREAGSGPRAIERVDCIERVVSSQHEPLGSTVSVCAG